MITLTALWLPILLSALAAWVISGITHQAIPLHKNDYVRLSGEDEVIDALRKQGNPPGDYVFPHAPQAQMNTPEMQAKWIKGPAGVLTVFKPGPLALGKILVQWLLYLIVVYVFVGYLASRVLSPGADYLQVFRVVGTTAFLAHAAGEPVMSIWFRRKWSTSLKNIFDGLLYALFAGGIFGWLWS